METNGEHTRAFVWLVVALVLGFILYITSIYQKRKKKAGDVPVHNPARPRPLPLGETEGPRRLPRNARQRMLAQRVRHTAEESQESSDEENVSKVPGKEEAANLGTKKLKRLQQKAEKKAERERIELARLEQKKQEKLNDEQRKKEEERLNMEREQLAEEERLRKEEKERQEREEYLKLKETFVVEGEGELVTETEEESQAKLREFIEFIKESKVVMLEDLASEFSLRVQEAIDRLENLEEMGLVTGVMDDRGKFIYISEEELNNVAKFIKRRGRVAISELAECSSKLIGMTGHHPVGRNQDVAPIAVDVGA